MFGSRTSYNLISHCAYKSCPLFGFHKFRLLPIDAKTHSHTVIEICNSLNTKRNCFYSSFLIVSRGAQTSLPDARKFITSQWRSATHSLDYFVLLSIKYATKNRNEHVNWLPHTMTVSSTHLYVSFFSLQNLNRIKRLIGSANAWIESRRWKIGFCAGTKFSFILDGFQFRIMRFVHRNRFLVNRFPDQMTKNDVMIQIKQ